MPTILDLAVKISFKGIEQMQKQAEKFENGMDKLAKSTVDDLAKMKTKTAAAFSAMTIAMVKASPLIQSSLDGIGFAFEDMAATMGDHVSPAFEMLEDAAFAISDAFHGLDENTQKFIAVTTFVAGVIGTAVAAFKLLGITISVATVGAFALLVAKIAIVSAVIAALIFGFQELIKNAPEISAKFSEAFESLKTKFQETMANISEKLTELKSQFVEKVRTAVLSVVDSVKNLAEKFAELKTKVVNKAVEIAANLKSKFSEAITKIKEFFGGLGRKFVDEIKGLPSKASEFFEQVKQTISTKISDIISKITTMKDDFVSAFDTLKESAFQKGKDVLTKFFDGLKSIKDSIVNKIKSQVVQPIQEAIEPVADKIKEASEPIRSAAQKAGEFAQKAGEFGGKIIQKAAQIIPLKTKPAQFGAEVLSGGLVEVHTREKILPPGMGIGGKVINIDLGGIVVQSPSIANNMDLDTLARDIMEKIYRDLQLNVPNNLV